MAGILGAAMTVIAYALTGVFALIAVSAALYGTMLIRGGLADARREFTVAAARDVQLGLLLVLLAILLGLGVAISAAVLGG